MNSVRSGEFRCSKCGRLLGKELDGQMSIRIRIGKDTWQEVNINGAYELSITCPKWFADKNAVCGELNTFRSMTEKVM